MRKFPAEPETWIGLRWPNPIGLPHLAEKKRKPFQKPICSQSNIRFGAVWRNFPLWVQQGASKREFIEMAQKACDVFAILLISSKYCCEREDNGETIRPEKAAESSFLYDLRLIPSLRKTKNAEPDTYMNPQKSSTTSLSSSWLKMSLTFF